MGSSAVRACVPVEPSLADACLAKDVLTRVHPGKLYLK